MRSVKRNCILIIFVLLTIQESFSQKQWQSAWEFSGAYTFDVGQSLDDVKKFSGYLGLAEISTGFSMEKAGWYKGGSVFFQGLNTHGAKPTSNFYQDLQVVSNIEAENRTYLSEFYYKQNLGNFSIKAGQIDINADFLVSDMGNLYVNSSFAIMPTVSYNFPLSLFPTTSLGTQIEYTVFKNSGARVGVFDGYSGEELSNNANMEWRIDKNEGFMGIAEVFHNIVKDSIDIGKYKLGFCYHSGYFNKIEDSTSFIKGNFGVHLLAEHIIVKSNKNPENGLGLFIQFGNCPNDRNIVESYFGAGLNYKGLINKERSDIIGLGIAHAEVGKKAIQQGLLDKSETTLELSYQNEITENIAIQPDLQYIINTGGFDTKNVLGFLRVMIWF